MPLKFVAKGPIIYIAALVQIMAWRRPGDKPLSEQMMVGLPTLIYASLGLDELNNNLYLCGYMGLLLKKEIIVYTEIYTARWNDNGKWWHIRYPDNTNTSIAHYSW